jgi:hypothetical protein
MLLSEEIFRMNKLMLVTESNKHKKNIFQKFDYTSFKEVPPPSDNSKETKKEIEYLRNIDLNKKFVQEKDDITGNFNHFLKTKGIDESKLVSILNNSSRIVILDLKNFYKRPRPFRLDPKLTDPMLKSMEGFAYPSGHSTLSNLLFLVLSKKYPKYKKELKKIKDNIVYSRQMAKAHYPSDIRFGELLAKSMCDYLIDNNLIG